MKTNTTSSRNQTFQVGLFLAGLILVPLAGARADYWGTSLATATPRFFSGGAVTTVTLVGSPDGAGIVSEAPVDCNNFTQCTSLARLFVPVTPPRGTQFHTIWLRAIDSHSQGYVRASFYRQNLLGGSPELLGYVTTQDGGHQVVSDKVRAIDNQGNSDPVLIGPLHMQATYTYYIEITIRTEGFLFDPKAELIGYDVGFDLDPCSSPELPGFSGLSCF